jgi:hypothetical protein
MDFLIGLIVVSLVIIILFNYASINISNNQNGINNSKCGSNSGMNDDDSGSGSVSGSVLKGPITKYANGNPGGYDYHNYFFLV